jgi:uncharacterized membrane protein
MNKEEFLQTLRRALNGDVPPGVVEENIRYYDSYITEEVRKGRSEEDVIAEIGDPRLIARTIEDTTDGSGGNPYEQNDSYEDADGRNTQQSSPFGSGNIHYFDLSKWYWKVLIAVIFFLVIYLILMIVGGIFSLLAPIIWPLLIIWLVFNIIRSFMNR